MRALSRLCAIAVALLFGEACAALPADEYTVKAAFVLNFVTLTEWPADTPPQLELCVFGQGPYEVMARALDGKSSGARTIGVRAVRSRGSLSGCNVVYIGRDEVAEVARILSEVAARSVLTIGEAEDLGRRGVMINLGFNRDRVVFEINQTAVRQTPLVLSSKLIRLAVTVY